MHNIGNGGDKFAATKFVAGVGQPCVGGGRCFGAVNLFRADPVVCVAGRVPVRRGVQCGLRGGVAVWETGLGTQFVRVERAGVRDYWWLMHFALVRAV